MSKIVTLKNFNEFDNVYKNGRSLADKNLVIYIMKNSLPYNRYGFSVSKKVGNSVVRHRVTRLIRESIRLSGHMFNSGLDILVIARNSVKDKKFEDVDASITGIMKRHGAIS